MRATIKAKTIIAENTLDVIFDLGNKSIKFLPGQFFFIELFRPPFNDANGPRRHFSFVNSPGQKNIIEMATRLSESAFKKSLAQLPEGTTVEIGPVAGKFVLPAETAAPLAFIAGGIGITPFMSMLNFIAEKKLDYKITLFYFNRSRAATAFYQKLTALEKKLPGLKIIFSMTDDPSWQKETGISNPELIKKYLPDYRNVAYYIAGPPAMVASGNKTLRQLGITAKNIKTENFTGYK